MSKSGHFDSVVVQRIQVDRRFRIWNSSGGQYRLLLRGPVLVSLAEAPLQTPNSLALVLTESDAG